MEYRAWLPQNSLFDGVILRHFDASIEQWAAKWFKSLPVFQCTFKPATEKRVLERGDYWQSEDGQLSAILSSVGSNVLVASILGVELPDTPILETDRKLLASIASDCFVDLLKILANPFEVDSEFDEKDETVSAHDRCGELVIKDDATGKIIAIVNIVMETMFEFRRGGLIDKVSTFNGKQREQALSRQEVVLGAFVGNSQISLGDLESLAPGDIIVLDRHVGSTLDMTVNNKVSTGIECGIIQTDNQINLKITKFDIED